MLGHVFVLPDVHVSVNPVAPAGSAPAKPIKKKVAGAAAIPASGATAAELQAIRDKIDAALKGISDRQAEEKKKAEGDAQKKELAAKDKVIKGLLDKLNAKHLSCERSPESGGCVADLAAETERLFAARRPVVQALQTFRRRARAVAATPECAELAVLRVTPNEVVRAFPGDTVSFIISQRAAGSPLAILEGPTDAESGIKFDFTPLQGTTLFVAKLQVGSKMAMQTVRLVVADSKGVVSQTVPVVAGRDPKAGAVAQAASAAASGAASAPKASASQPLAKA